MAKKKSKHRERIEYGKGVLFAASVIALLTYAGGVVAHDIFQWAASNLTGKSSAPKPPAQVAGKVHVFRFAKD